MLNAEARMCDNLLAQRPHTTARRGAGVAEQGGLLGKIKRAASRRSLEVLPFSLSGGVQGVLSRGSWTPSWTQGQAPRSQMQRRRAFAGHGRMLTAGARDGG